MRHLRISPDAINHNTLNEPVMADDSYHADNLYAFEHNFLAGQLTNIDLPSNGVVTSKNLTTTMGFIWAILLKMR